MINAMYWDISSRNTMKYLDNFVNMLVETNMNEVIVMVNDDGKEKLAWDIEDLKAFTVALSNVGIITSVISWIRPRKDSVDTVMEIFRKVQKEIPEIFTFEFDAEGKYSDKHLDGSFKTLQEASDYIEKEINTLDRDNVQIGVSVHTGRLNSTLSTKFDYVNIQSYSIWRKDNKENELRTPVNFQKYAYDKIAKVCKEQDIYMALAAWCQRGFPNYTPEESMKAQYKEAERLGVSKVAYWSAKWVYGHNAKVKNYYAYGFLALL